ncbi:unnamed protein product [Clonostachys rosea]|uniref:Fungal N-terminal domain-containing protein n=1 Tax=Bionectria ochroleuca TaxID=29856 RepID=A0ABY6UWV6_BIOOC|nr:unnamed protein product [Clonostachys rosea]
MAEIISVAFNAGQLFPLLFDVCETLKNGSAEIKLIARNVETLSNLLRELAEALDKGDAVYPPGIRLCAQQASDNCNDTCTELQGLILKMEKNRSTKVLRKKRLNDLQMRLELQKSTLLATINLASFTREIQDTSITSDPPNGGSGRVEEKRAKVNASLAKAVSCDKMRILQKNLDEHVDRSDTASPASDSTEPSDLDDTNTSLLAPSQNNLDPLASSHSLTRYASPCAGQASLISRGSDYRMEQKHKRYSPSSSGEENKILLNLLSYWAALQEMCDSSQPVALREYGKGSSSREVAQLYGSTRDIARTHEMHHRLEDAAARSPSPDWFSSIDAKAPQQLVPRTRTDNALSQPLSGSGGFRFSVSAPGDAPQGTGYYGYYDGTPPGLLRSPAPPHVIQDKPPSPPYSTPSTPNPDHGLQNVEHHHHAGYRYAAPQSSALMPVSYDICDNHNCRTNCPTTNTRQIEPLSSQRFSRVASSPTAPDMFPHPKLPLTYPNDTVGTNRAPMADEFWNVLQANGGVQWETRKKRKDRLLVRQYVGPIMHRQGEAVWSDLTFWGSAWTSLPRRYCSRAVLLGMLYEFREDDRHFHIVEELDYSQVEEITRLSLRTLECRAS